MTKEQQYWEDAISRQSVMDCFKKWQPYMATRLFDFEKELLALPSVPPQESKWIPANKELPKANEYIGDVAKYYLVQDEYGDMLIARYCGGYWEEIHQLQPIEDKIVAWRELPKSYKVENDVEDIYCDRNLCVCYECENCPVNKEVKK